jgi:hypothetical protein
MLGGLGSLVSFVNKRVESTKNSSKRINEEIEPPSAPKIKTKIKKYIPRLSFARILPGPSQHPLSNQTVAENGRRQSHNRTPGPIATQALPGRPQYRNPNQGGTRLSTGGCQPCKPHNGVHASQVKGESLQEQSALVKNYGHAHCDAKPGTETGLEPRNVIDQLARIVAQG